MFCPLCGARTEVSEKRGIFRDRRCTNADCGFDFTTRENVMTLPERRRLCARTRATKIQTSPRSPDAHLEVGSTFRPTLAAPSDPEEGMSGVQEKQPFRQAEAAA